MTEHYQSLWRGLIPVKRPYPIGLHVLPREVLDDVLAEVEDATGVTAEQILGGRRFKAIARARQLAMWMLREGYQDEVGRPRYSYPEIARKLLLLDHTSVIHGVRAHQARMATEPPQPLRARSLAEWLSTPAIHRPTTGNDAASIHRIEGGIHSPKAQVEVDYLA